MDCWDGGSDYDNEPVIYHGKTLTSKIYFKAVLEEAVKPHAFCKSDYPLILSIENHCSVYYQDKMADHLVNILDDMLYKEPVDESRTELPSPEELGCKVLVKAKKYAATEEQGSIHLYSNLPLLTFFAKYLLHGRRELRVKATTFL